MGCGGLTHCRPHTLGTSAHKTLAEGVGVYRVWSFLNSYSLFLIGGAIAALIWANTNLES
jgi:hypothetical protein